MSRIDGPDPPAIAGGAPPARRDLSLPWTWPDGSRTLLAVVAIAMAIGLLASAGRRDRTRERRPGAPFQAAALKLDPNTASAEALAALPRIGPTLARRIVEAQAAGPFRSPEDLRARVRGIGPVTLARIEPYLRFDDPPGPRPGIETSAIAIAEATSRKPPRSMGRKPKGPSVRLTAKARAPSASP